MNKLLERLERSCPEVAQKFSQSFTCTAKTPQAQQAEINGFLRCHLGSLEVNTQKEREYLIDQRPVGLCCVIWNVTFFRRLPNTGCNPNG